MIKNPFDFIATMIVGFKVPISTELKPQYNNWAKILNTIKPLQMVMLDLPSVSGWKAYYQEPSYYQNWLNSVTLPFRITISDTVLLNGLFGNNNSAIISILSLINNIQGVSDVNILLEKVTNWLLPKPLNASQLEILKNVLLNGLPDYEWTVEYQTYLNNPTDTNLRRALEAKLSSLFVYICRMPEFQLS
jgi:hypothetical protein